MEDIFLKVLIIGLIFTLLGLLTHFLKYISSSSYREKIKDKKIIKNDFNNFLNEFKKLSDENQINEKFFNFNLPITSNLLNYKEIEQDIKNKLNSDYPNDINIFNCIGISIYTDNESEFEKILKKKLKKNIGESLKFNLKNSLERLERHKNLVEDLKSKNNFKLINFYYTKRFKVFNMTDKIKNKIKDKDEYLTNLLDNYTSDLDNLLNTVDGNNNYKVKLENLLIENKELEDVFNLYLIKAIYEKIDRELIKEINNLKNS